MAQDYQQNVVIKLVVGAWWWWGHKQLLGFPSGQT